MQSDSGSSAELPAVENRPVRRRPTAAQALCGPDWLAAPSGCPESAVWAPVVVAGRRRLDWIAELFLSELRLPGLEEPNVAGLSRRPHRWLPGQARAHLPARPRYHTTPQGLARARLGRKTLCEKCYVGAASENLRHASK